MGRMMSSPPSAEFGASKIQSHSLHDFVTGVPIEVGIHVDEGRAGGTEDILMSPYRVRGLLGPLRKRLG
jgi:hypothetical protein